ncbi:Golgi to ER traffic protein 4 homolog [Condylostylus longicornis]|uniref:Golgi to ER traffic protein 4 homolog n=1 Tax=Condylostylus longicornis TaxID=2530218 RepID=UPI00244DC238|nr:Golgi to ER traffic protein 4 homolog [Condylostylus longicornis]XP_055377723.1 Golgi to ER traffic protein 4 homolog [Condylostylus longicornis]XP_055377732.1 Golgi to ER traffic protein 4 homolog [Condylostylus longicornis]XP_055377741.1 Golgi to ER traffic protein 4 homolog [Condylostylus longicornis]
MTDKTNRGVSRVLSKLEASIAAGNYYEAHQMYRTLYFRYNAQKKYDECLDLLYRGSLTLVNKEQYSSGADLALLVIETLEKKGTEIGEDIDLWIQRLGVLIRKITPTTVEREAIINRAVRWSGEVSKNNLGNPQMHKVIAQIMWAENNMEQARHHYLLSRDGLSCGQMLVKLSQSKGYESEIDLFIAQVVLQQLCLKETDTALQTFETYTKYHPKIASSEPPFILPLLNFIFFLLKTIEAGGRLIAFKSLCDLYKPSIERDPSYEKYLQKIGVIFFGVPSTQPTGGLMGGMFGDLFRLFRGLEDEDDNDDDDERNSTNTSRGINRNNANNTSPVELD